MELFKIFGSIVIDDKKALQSLKEADKEAKNNQKSLNEVNKTLDKVGKGIIAAFTVTAVVGFTKKVVETTAKLQAMDSQFEQVFGSDKETAMAKINAQSEQLNIHSDRLKDSWSKFGAQFKGAGMEGELAMQNVNLATTLAADSAAFYDISLQNATGSLTSFLKGNFAAGDAIGVFTNATQMSKVAQDEFGLSWQQLTEAQKQDLLLQKVNETYQLNGATGQAIRESENWENVTGNLSATWERFLANVGSPVLDLATKAIGGLTDAIGWLEANLNIVIPVVAALTSAIVAQLIVNALSKAMSAYKAVTTSMTFAQWALNTAMNANPFGVVAMVIGGLVLAGGLLVANWDKVKTTAEGLWKKIKETFGKIGEFVGGIWNGIKSALKLPTISLTGKFSIIPPSIPKFNINWNAEGGIFSKPTIFGTNAGYQGVGEAGAEAIMPIEKLPKLLGLDKQNNLTADSIEAIVSSIMNNMNFNMVLDNGALVGQLAPGIDARLGRLNIEKGRGRR